MFRVSVPRGSVVAFKKALRKYDVEIAQCIKTNPGFIVVFEDETMGVLDAVDFFPSAQWSPVSSP